MLNLDLTGKTAVITGATGELGRVITKTLADCGAAVGIVYHGAREKADALAAAISAAGGRAATAQADVGDEASVFAMRDRLTAALGPPTILVNNAVVQCFPWKSVLEQPLADYESQFRSSVMHNVLMARAFVPGMIRAGKGGRVIAISTECVMQASPTYSAYISGKRGMDGVLRVLAREIGPHQITVNQVAPGWMISDKFRTEKGVEPQPGYESNVPLRRRGEDQDIANTVAFLASDLANFITGQFLSVSGGNVMPTI
jgi:3-oxoacyl-[acyl-carrier protein] reductase